MASVLNAKKVDSAPPGAPCSRPSKIPVRTSYSSSSASDDSDNSSKSESKPKTGGKSRLPVPVVKSPAKKVPNSSKAAGTSGSESDPEKNSTKGVQEEVAVPATEKSNITNEDNDTGVQPIKMPARLKSLKLKKKSSVNQARCDPLARSLIPDINKKETPVKASSDALAFVQQGRLRPARKFQAKKTDDLPEKKQQRPFKNIRSVDQKDKPGKKVYNVGKKDQKKTSSSSESERSNSSCTGIKTKTITKASITKKASHSKTKESGSSDSSVSDSLESDNSLALKPTKCQYETESDDFVSTDSESLSAPKAAQSNNEDDSDNQWSFFDQTFEFQKKKGGSYNKEQDELLSAAETDIEEAFQDDETCDGAGDHVPNEPGAEESDSMGKGTSALDIDIPDTTVFQQNERYDKLAELVEDLCVQEVSLVPISCSDGMGTNESSTTAGKPSGSEKDEQSGKTGSNRQGVAGGSSISQGSSVGGSGDGDDPNDPKKPKPRKEPEDKKDEDDDKPEKERAARKALDKDTLKDELTMQDDKASQTDEEEETVEALQKTIRSKDKEIVLMQNLVDCCRKDYEELQESFHQYTTEFKEVDENRAKIGALKNENNILRQENLKLKNQVSQKTSEATQAQEKSKKLKNMLSKMEVDLDFLETEKKELLAKLKLYEANAPLETVEVVQKAEDTKEQMENRLEHGLGRSCSLQNVEAMKTEEENVELKNKLHQCEASLKSQKKECTDFKEKLAKIATKEDQLKSRIQRLTTENDVLNSKCSQLVGQLKEASIGEKIEDLRNLERELFEASKDLATEGNELKVTSSPLSVELAEADTSNKTQPPGASQTSELQMLIHSLTAMTEELRVRIKMTKAKIAKAYPANDDSELENKNEELVKQLNEEIASLNMKLEDEAAKSQQLGYMVESSNTERQRLEERIEELEKELCKAEDNLTQTQIYKDREINNIRHDSEMKELKVNELASHLETVLEAHDSMRNLLQNQYSKVDRLENKEKELKNYIEELEMENETLLKDLSEQKLKLLDVRRQNIEKEEIPREDFEKLQNALTNKIDSMTDVMNDVEQIKANDPFVEGHPCAEAIESAMQMLYDISRLLKAIGHACLKAIGCSCTSNGDQVPGPSTGGEDELVEGESRLKELESMIDVFKEQLNDLKEENQRLEKKLKEKRVRFAEGTKGGESDEVLRLREQLQERETQLEKLEEEMIRLQAENDTLTDYLGEVRDKAVRDTEALRDQAQVHLDHIQTLQEDCESQRMCVKNLKTELSEYKEKNATLDKNFTDVATANLVLEQKLEAIKDDENARRESEIHLNHIQKLQEDCEKQRMCVKNLKTELSEYKQKNATLDKNFTDVATANLILEQKLEAIKDDENVRRQSEIHLNHIQKLQGDCEKQRMCVKSLKGELSELKNKNTTVVEELKNVEAEKQALEQKLKALSPDMQKDSSLVEANKHEGEESISGTPSTSSERDERIKELQGFNEKLNEKIDMYEAFFEQVKEDKAQSMKAIDASRQNAMMLKTKSDEQITELEKKLEDKSVLETKLQDTVMSLEKRISTLEAEKLESENQVKAMVESIKGQNELEKSKKEWQQLELELRNSILTLTTEKSETQKELEEEKLVVANASESLEIRMKELDECLQERQVLQEELVDLKSIHAKQKELMDKKMKKMGLDVEEYEAEVKLVRQSSSEIICELEKQLKERRDSETELMERAEVLSQLIDQLKAEKLESDKKIQALMKSIEAKENEAKLKRFDESNDNASRYAFSSNVVGKEQHDTVLVRKESEEKIAALEKRLQEQSDSESMLQEKVHSLESRISQLNDEKTERDDNMKTLMQAMDANKNLEEKIKIKEQVERELASKVQEMKLKLSRIKSTKKHLERQFAKKQSEFVFSSRKSKRQSKQLQDDLDECLEREKELNVRLKKLSEDSHKEEERGSQMRVLENQMLSKRESEQMLKEKMVMLEEKISRLESEKSQHCKNISSIIRKLKIKEDLADAVTARDEAEREYKIKIDEMEVIVNKLRKERSKADCDEELKEGYRQEYEESRRNVRRLTENVNRCNERVKELQAFVSGSVEDEPKEVKKPSLHENIEDLKRTLKDSDAELFKKLQSLNEKITHLEYEKAEGEKMITAMLKSLEDKEKMEHCIATSREADKKMIQHMNEMAEDIKKLRTEKKRVEDDLQKSEKMRAAKECESELQQNQIDEKISSLQQSLKERCESEWEIQKRLETMSNKLAQMESAKEQADKTIQTMLESLQWKDNLEYCLEEKDKIEKELKRRVQELKLENKEALMEAKKYQVQSRDAHLMKEQISSLTEQLLKMECDKQMALESMKELLKQKDYHLQQMASDKDNAINSMQELLQEKEDQLLQISCDKDKALENMKELLQQKVQQMECDKDKAIENMKILLQQKEEQLDLVEKTLKQEVLKLKLEKKDLEIETTKSQIQTRDAFELVKKQSNEFEECLGARNESSERMMAEMENLKKILSKTVAERDELENKAKKYAKLSEERQEEVEKTVQREVELLQKLSDAQKEITDLEAQRRGSDKELIETRMDATETVKGYKEKVKKLCETLKLQCDQEKELRHMLNSLSKQNEALEAEKENAIQEGTKVVDRQCQREMELNEQLGNFEDEINQLRKELDDQAKREEVLREEHSIEIRNIRESTRVEKEKLLNEIEELNNDKSSSTRASRKLISELRNSENELLEKLNDLKLVVRTLEGDKRRISMEYKDYQSDILNMTQTSRDTNTRMHAELNILREKNNNLQAQLNEMKLKESRLLKDKQFLKQENEENERKIKQKKNKIQKQKIEITRVVDREGDLKNEIIELRGKISAEKDERVQEKAEHRSQENRLMHEAKAANAKITELQLHILKKCNTENNLKDEIEELKHQISELNRAVESERLDKVEITSKHNITKGHIIELENSIDKKDQEIKRLDRSIEELRAQVLRLQHEKWQISDSLEICQTSLSQRNAGVHILEMIKLSD